MVQLIPMGYPLKREISTQKNQKRRSDDDHERLQRKTVLSLRVQNKVLPQIKDKTQTQRHEQMFPLIRQVRKNF